MKAKMHNRQAGLSLIELVVTISLMSVVGVSMCGIIGGPIRQYLEVANRTSLAGVGDQALRVMAADIRAAVPNTARIHEHGNTLEFLHTAVAKVYREGSSTDAEGLYIGDLFQFGGGDRFFRVLGNFDAHLYGDHPTWRAVVYPLPEYTNNDMNQPGPGVNVYSDNGLWYKDIYAQSEDDEGRRQRSRQRVPHYGKSISSAGVSFAPGDQIHEFSLDDQGWEVNAAQDIVKLQMPHTFAQHSQRQRVFFSDTPITFHCDATLGRLTKYWGYTLTEEQPVPGSSNVPHGGQSALVADGIKSCRFNFDRSQGLNYSVVTITLELLGNMDEEVTLSQKVHIRNDA